MGHFDFVPLSLGGAPAGETITVKTTTGILLNCHPGIDHAKVEHLAAIARETPNYPVDITHFMGPEGEREMVWNARIYWRGDKAPSHV